MLLLCKLTSNYKYTRATAPPAVGKFPVDAVQFYQSQEGTVLSDAHPHELTKAFIFSFLWSCEALNCWTVTPRDGSSEVYTLGRLGAELHPCLFPLLLWLTCIHSSPVRTVLSFLFILRNTFSAFSPLLPAQVTPGVGDQAHMSRTETRNIFLSYVLIFFILFFKLVFHYICKPHAP